MSTKVNIRGTLFAPERQGDIPVDAQWLSGEGAGSWFHIDAGPGNTYRIRRFSPKGLIECDSRFNNKTSRTFFIEKAYKFIHLSHCTQVKIEQNGHIFTFNRTEQ